MAVSKFSTEGRRLYGCVYFLQAGIAGPIKIGFACDYAGAFYSAATLQTYAYEDLRLLGVVPAVKGFETERELHRQFKTICRRGEWFSPDETLIAYIKEYAFMPLPPRASFAKFTDRATVDGMKEGK